MARWLPITIASLYEAKVAALIDAADASALKAGQANRSAGIIQGVVDHVRRKIASCKRNQLDVDTTAIPTGLKELAVDLIIAKLKIAIEQDLNEDERLAVARHERNLNRIADCQDVIEQPDNPLPSFNEMQTSTGVTSVAGTRRATRENLDGI